VPPVVVCIHENEGAKSVGQLWGSCDEIYDTPEIQQDNPVNCGEAGTTSPKFSLYVTMLR
jgi:hypothetical protein